jgi:hypothetical protein
MLVEADFTREQRHDFTIRKEILGASETATMALMRWRLGLQRKLDRISGTGSDAIGQQWAAAPLL